MRVHVALPSVDLGRSVDFYTRLFGVGPDKVHADHARFQPDDVPLVLTLDLVGAPTGGDGATPRHLGFKLDDEATASAWIARAQLCGLDGKDDDGRCCYAEQRKAWFVDPDGHRWEVYAVLAETEERGAGAVPCCPDPTRCC